MPSTNRKSEVGVEREEEEEGGDCLRYLTGE